MSYLILARKYRPRTFSEILGQEAIVRTLTNAIKQKRTAHGYLFSGPRGTGKTSTARIFAKALNCEKGPTPTPCLQCDSCEEIAEGRSLDVIEIDGASNRGIDEIRELRQLARFAPASGAAKVYIIDEVHQITDAGFNALLKTLEEPPAHVIFVMATTAPHKVPATILSRCQRYDFKRLPVGLITRKIGAVCKEERIEIEKEAVLAIARAAAGSLRDAESILDQAAAYSSGKVKAEDVRTLLGLTDREVFASVLVNVREQNAAGLLEQVAEAADAGTDLERWTRELVTFCRDVLVAKVGQGKPEFEEWSQETAERLAELAGRFNEEELTALVQELTAALRGMRWVDEPRIPLEVALVRLAAGGPLVPLAELVERLEALESRAGARASEGPSPRPSAAGRAGVRAGSDPSGRKLSSTGSDPVGLKTEGEGKLGQVQALWSRFMREVHDRKAATAAYLSQAIPAAVEEGDPPLLVIGFPKGFEFHRHALDKQQEAKKLIQELLGQLLGWNVRCAFRMLDKPAAAPAAGPGAEAEPPAGKEAPSSTPGPAGSSYLDSVTELFEGRILPGEG